MTTALERGDDGLSAAAEEEDDEREDDGTDGE